MTITTLFATFIKSIKILLKSPRPSFLIKQAALGNLKASFHCTHWHRFFPLKRAPPLTPTLSPSGEREETAPPRRSEPLRSKVGGASKVSPNCAGWDRRDAIGDMTSATASTAARSSFAANSSAAIDRVQKELGLWKFAGGIMYIMQEVFGMPASRLIVPPNEKYGKFVLNEVLEAGNFGKHDERIRFGRSQFGHNLQRVYRDMRLIKYFPAEALSEPIFRVWHFFWRMKNKK